MTSRGKVLVVASLVVLTSVGYGFAQTERAGQATATRPAPSSTQAAPSIMTVVPADAWGVIGVNDLEKLDTQVTGLLRNLGLPPVVQVSGLIQMYMGIGEGFNPRGGVAVIFLDKIKYNQAKGWETFNNLPAPMVLAVAATDPQSLIKSMGGKSAEQEGMYTALVGKDEVAAAVKGNYVVFSPDAELVKVVAGVGAPATRPASTALPAGLITQINGSNLFVLVNVKPIMTAFDPIVRGMLAMFAMGQGQGAEGQNMGQAAGAYYDILSKQLDKLVVLGNLESDGLTLSGVVTFQNGTLLNKLFASLKPAEQPILAGLPDGQFVLAGGSYRGGEQYAKDLADLFSKPMLDILKNSGNEKMIASAEQQTKIMNLRLQLTQMKQSGHFGVYLLPEAKNGLLAVAVSAQFTDGPKAYDLIQQIVKLQVDSLSAQQPKAKEFLETVAYTPEAETVDGAKVNVLLVDVTKFAKIAPNMSEKDSEQLIKVVKALFGTEGLTARIVVGEKDIVMGLGGGTAFLKKTLDTTKASAAPLLKQEAVAKVAARLPKNRVATFYLSGENLTRVAKQVSKAAGEDSIPVEPGPTSAPLAGMMLADPVGLHVSLYVPTELMVSARGMVNQSMQGGESQGHKGVPATRPAKSEPAEPKPEF